ncbi:MAG: hypothetical protein C6I01_02855 [Epsilonproteobacteria bacterium]|nr:hypothetical protein [Campylobacterota bacterium]
MEGADGDFLRGKQIGKIFKWRKRENRKGRGKGNTFGIMKGEKNGNYPLFYSGGRKSPEIWKR